MDYLTPTGRQDFAEMLDNCFIDVWEHEYFVCEMDHETEEANVEDAWRYLQFLRHERTAVQCKASSKEQQSILKTCHLVIEQIIASLQFAILFESKLLNSLRLPDYAKEWTDWRFEAIEFRFGLKMTKFFSRLVEKLKTAELGLDVFVVGVESKEKEITIAARKSVLSSSIPIEPAQWLMAFNDIMSGLLPKMPKEIAESPVYKDAAKFFQWREDEFNQMAFEDDDYCLEKSSWREDSEKWERATHEDETEEDEEEYVICDECGATMHRADSNWATFDRNGKEERLRLCPDCFLDLCDE